MQDYKFNHYQYKNHCHLYNQFIEQHKKGDQKYGRLLFLCIKKLLAIGSSFLM